MSVLFRREPSGSLGGGRVDIRQVLDRPNKAQLSAIAKIIEQRLVTVEFQPIVRMGSGEVVAFESFARGPVESPLATPEAMFRAAAAAGLIGELDLLAASAAYTAAGFSPQARELTFFVNTDPAGLVQERSAELAEATREAMSHLRVVAELSEQALVHDPLGTIAAARRLSRSGARIAVDNVGTSPQGIALIPFLGPDVIKLAPHLVTSPAQRMAQVVDAVASYTERYGGLIIAQGIEKDGHLSAAVGMGAVLGQGYLFGRPMTVPVAKNPPTEPLELGRARTTSHAGTSPFALLAVNRAPIRVDLPMFEALAINLMDRAEAQSDPSVILIAGTDAPYLAGGRSARLRSLSQKAALLLLLSTNPDIVAPRDLNVALVDPTDPMRDELVLVVISPYAASMLVARRVDEGTYDCLLTHDRGPVLAAAQSMLRRAIPDE